VEKDENTRCSFRCNWLILGEVARPERFELPAFWFVGRSAKTSKCRYWYRLLDGKSASRRRTNLILRRFVVDGSRLELSLNCGLVVLKDAILKESLPVALLNTSLKELGD